jgi:hypothetical protein
VLTSQNGRNSLPKTFSLVTFLTISKSSLTSSRKVSGLSLHLLFSFALFTSSFLFLLLPPLLPLFPGRLARECVVKVLQLSTALFIKECNILQLTAPLSVCGDVHGQFYDLAHLFETSGSTPGTLNQGTGTPNQYLFLGDYVDRGSFSIEVMIYILSLKLNFPSSVHLLRGNHESRSELPSSALLYSTHALCSCSSLLISTFLLSIQHFPTSHLLFCFFFFFLFSQVSHDLLQLSVRVPIEI